MAGKPVTDLVGQRFGKLFVVGRTKNALGRTAWVTRCDCGNEKVVNTGVLNNASTQSCRCFQKEVASKICAALGHSQLGKATKHGHFINKHRTPEYQSWSGMRDRCERPGHTAYKDYGGRGIKICKRWRSKNGFEKFLADMGPRPKDKTLDRKKVNGNYTPLNCQWATAKEQALNRRRGRDRLRSVPTKDLIFELTRRGL